MQQKFWLVYVDGKTGSTRKHETHTEAVTEAERLARQSQNEGVDVYVLEAVSKCHTVRPEVIWE